MPENQAPIMPAPKQLLAAFTRKVVEEIHGTWDGLHSFLSLYYEGGEIRPGEVTFIDPHINPDEYPPMLFRRVAKIVGVEGKAPYAWLLQFEGHGVMEFPWATDAERAQLARDRRSRSYHKRDDAVEGCQAYCVDIHGRTWTACKYRADNSIREAFFRPDSPDISGQFVQALRTIAAGTATVAYGMPAPPWGAN